jgi:hypothetical protein
MSSGNLGALVVQAGDPALAGLERKILWMQQLMLVEDIAEEQTEMI